ncbi:hypothetical protein P7C65_07s2g10600 [Encephalitozoon intestinalis]
MKRSIKVCHSKTYGFPSGENICHQELAESFQILSAVNLLVLPESFVRIEFFSTRRSVFTNDSFNATDIYSVYRNGELFFNSSPLPWESDAQIPWAEYRKRLVDYISKRLAHGIENMEGLNDRYIFYTKYRLANSINPRQCRKDLQKLSKEFKLLERIEVLRLSTQKEISGPLADEVYNIFLSYKSDPELEIRFILEVIDILPLSVIVRMARSISKARRYQAVLLYYEVYLRSLQKERYRTAFLFAISASRLLKQGVNLNFEGTIKSDAIRCIKEKNWQMVLKNVIKGIEELDSLRYGVNPYILHDIDRCEFTVDSVELDWSNITKCSDTVLFNGESTRTYFTDRFRIRILFSRISCANLHGISGSIAGGPDIFIPIYQVLNESPAVVQVFFDLAKVLPSAEDRASELELNLKRLVFSENIVVPIDLEITWVRRKSTVHVKDASTIDDEGKIIVLLVLSNQEGFESRILGPDVIERNGCETTVSLHVSKGFKVCLRHEISESIFETFELTY